MGLIDKIYPYCMHLSHTCPIHFHLFHQYHMGKDPGGQAVAGFPLGLENLEKWEGIFQSGKSQGILNRLEKSGKSQGKSHKILENSGNFRQILFFIF